MGMSKLIGLMIMFFVVLFASANKPKNCNDVVVNFDWCPGYLEGSWNDVAPQCCLGLQRLNSIAKDEGPRRICECIQKMANHQFDNVPYDYIPYEYIPSRISNLYVRCNVHLSFPISQSMNCSKI